MVVGGPWLVLGGWLVVGGWYSSGATRSLRDNEDTPALEHFGLLLQPSGRVKHFHLYKGGHWRF